MSKTLLKIATAVLVLASSTSTLAQGMESCTQSGMGDQIASGVDPTGNKRAISRDLCAADKIRNQKEFEQKWGKEPKPAEPKPAVAPAPTVKPTPAQKTDSGRDSEPRTGGGGRPGGSGGGKSNTDHTGGTGRCPGGGGGGKGGREPTLCSGAGG